MIAQLLRTDTAEKHKTLETLMFVNEIMNNSLSTADYKKLLITNYIIHAKLEDELFSLLNEKLSTALNLEDRKKLPALEKDLKYWGIDSSAYSHLADEVNQNTSSQADILGALYVLEGATLGGNLILKHILANQNFEGKQDGLNYYGVYGSELGSNWKTFVQVLNENVDENDHETCISSANAMFDKMIFLAKKVKDSVA